MKVTGDGQIPRIEELVDIGSEKKAV